MPKPPRKSNVPIVAATGDEGTPSKEKEKEKEKDGISIEDLSLPRTMVQRLAKGVLPPNTQIQKDAITAMSKGATVFVNYLSNAANQHTHASAKKTITPGDVLLAIRDLEFDNFTPRLEAELAKFNQVQTGKRNEYRRKVKESGVGGGKNGNVGGGGAGAGGGGDEGMVLDGGEVGERASKRVRRKEGVGNGVDVEVPGGKMEKGEGEEGRGGDDTVDEDEGEGEVGDDVEDEEDDEEGSGEEGEDRDDGDVVGRDESASDEALDDAEDSD